MATALYVGVVAMEFEGGEAVGVVTMAMPALVVTVVPPMRIGVVMAIALAPLFTITSLMSPNERLAPAAVGCIGMPP